METTNTVGTLDTSGNNYTATNNAATWPTWTITGTNQNGRVEHSFDFDGSLQHFKAYGPSMNGATAITMFAWINRKANGAYKGIFGENATDLRGLLLNGGGTGVRFDVSGTGANNALGTGVVPLNQWVFVAGRWYANSTAEIYTNGVLEATAASAQASLTTAGGLLIGSYGSGSPYCFNGPIK